MLKVTPHKMEDGLVTSILITDDKFREVIDITPIPFERIVQEDVKKVVSLYYLKKKTCENLLQQLAIAQGEFEDAKTNFESMIMPEKEQEKTILAAIPEEQISEPEQTPISMSEPIIRSEEIESAPAPTPKTTDEIVTSIIDSNEFKALVINDQVSDDTIRTVISNNTSLEMVDTIYELVMTRLKEEGAHGFKIEPGFMEKAGNIFKKKGKNKKTNIK